MNNNDKTPLDGRASTNQSNLTGSIVSKAPRTIHFSVNTHGTDKAWDFELLASKFEDKTGSLQTVVDHVKQGHALCAGLLGGRRRTKANVIGSQWVLLDIDNSVPLLDETGNPVKDENGKSIKVYDPQLTLEQAVKHPFIQQHCALIYTSASHRPDWHKFRVVFLLPQFESDTGIIESMIRLLMEQLPNDPSCKDCSRVFYGNSRAEIPLFNAGATLPAEWREMAIASAANESAKKETQRQAREVKQTQYQSRVASGSVNPGDTDDLVLQALQHIPSRQPGSGTYEESLTVLMALFDHFGASEAERIGEQWSPSIPGTSWNVGRKIASFKRGGVTIGSLFHIAQRYGWKFPEQEQRHYRQGETTIDRETWEHRFGLPEWLKCQIGRFTKYFKKSAKFDFEPDAPKPKPEKPPRFMVYEPDHANRLPKPEDHYYYPPVRFKPGQRTQLLSELVALGHKHILDTSATGTSKSHDAGLVETSRLGANRLWYFSEDHRNPTTAPVEANYADLPVRHNGLIEDHTRRTALNNPQVHWPRAAEEPTTEGNCFRTHQFHILAAKGYQTEINATAELNPICGSCHLSSACAGGGDATPQPGARFRNDRRETFLNNRIRASLNSAPSPSDLEAKVKPSENGEADEITNKNIAFVDEAMRQLKSTDIIEADLSDFDQVFGELEARLPDIHATLKTLRLALRSILAGEIKPTRETYHGWNDAAVRNALTDFREHLFSVENKDADLIIPEILEQLKTIKPDFRGILSDPDGFNKNGVDAKNRKEVSNDTSKFIRSHVRQESYRDITKELRSLAPNWLTPFLEVWSGSRRGALRINNGVLSVTTRNTRHADVLKAMQAVIYLDATASREYLAQHLDIDPREIIQIEQEQTPVPNLTIVQVTTLGLAGHGRSDSLKARIAALKQALKERRSDIALLEHMGCAEEGDGYWFRHNRGSNEYKSRAAIASFGTPYQNVGSLQDLWLTLTGDRNVDKDAPGFSAFVQWQTQSEIVQAVGRLRANLRPNESLTYYFCGDFGLDFLQQYYPGATIRQESAFAITPAAGTETEQSHWRVQQGIVGFIRATGESLERLTQATAATAIGVSQGRISQIASNFGGWKAYKKLLAALFNSLYAGSNKFPTLSAEQNFVAGTYLPVLSEEDPPDIVKALLVTAKAYGWKAFEAILAATPPQTRGKLLAALIGGLPPGQRDEMRSLLNSLATT